MKLKSELPVEFKNKKNEAISSLYWTGLLLKKVSREFLSPYLNSEAQFNILILLKDSLEPQTQKELSEKLIVDKSNITGMIDRMEKLKLLKRIPHHKDHRSYIIQLTQKGQELAIKLEQLYLEKVNEVMKDFSENQIKEYIRFNEMIRIGLLNLKI